jgi:hypothetical protein
MVMLEFNSIELLGVALRASRRASADFARRKNPHALTSDSLVAIVFSAAAVEAFTNDLVDHVRVWQTADWAPGAATPALIIAAQKMVAIQSSREREQLLKKFRAATRALAGKPKGHDEHDIQELGRLVQFRDAIMHATARSVERRRKLSCAAADLERRRMTVPTPGGKANLFLRAQSPALAKWAYRTARALILAMLDQAGDAQAVQTLNREFRNRRKFPDVRLP